MGTKTESSAQGNAITRKGERKTPPQNDVIERIFLYRLTMVVIKCWLEKSIISKRDYGKAENIMTKKYGLSSSSIFR